MTEHKHEELRRLFDLAIAAPSHEREALLDHGCGDDAELRRRIKAMVAAADDDNFLGTPTSDALSPIVDKGIPSGNAETLDTSPNEKVGQQIGRYRLLQLIGEGGFGAVYMAEQREPVKRRVALKIIKLGMDTKQVIARFEAERQALAMMDHPNIAKVLDAGATETGRPYFVMELVKGVPIAEYCDTENLTTKERLGLFIDVCNAVQHAHQKGIIHRDLKPSNVMVTLHDGKPVPKVIDFGIAKATNRELTEKTLFTEYRQFIGTPEYMSPEQAEMSGLDIDTRSDIYSLGVMLYELLTGTTPFDPGRLRSAAINEIQRIIREEEPSKPSTRLSSLHLKADPDRDTRSDEAQEPVDERSAIQLIAQHRGTDPAHLVRELRGDLDWIAMKAMEKDRTRRYETANGLAMDIRRHISDDPVMARPPSTWYRMCKLVRRHRIAVFVAAMMSIVVVGALVTSSLFALGQTRARADTEAARQAEIRQREEAESQRNRAIEAERAAEVRRAEAERQAAIAQAVNNFLNKDLLASAAADSTGRDITMREVLDAASEKIAGRFPDEPLAEAAIRATLGGTYQDLGSYEQARPHLERLLELQISVRGEAHPRTLLAMHNLGVLYLKLGREDDALTLLAACVEGARQRMGNGHMMTGVALLDYGRCLARLHRHEDAEEALLQAHRNITTALGADHQYSREAALALSQLYDAWGRPEKAAEWRRTLPAADSKP